MAWISPITHSTIHNPHPSWTSFKKKSTTPLIIPVTMMTFVLPIRSPIYPPTGPAHNPEENTIDIAMVASSFEAPSWFFM